MKKLKGLKTQVDEIKNNILSNEEVDRYVNTRLIDNKNKRFFNCLFLKLKYL